MDDNWRQGEAYEGYMGRWSRPLARSFVQWLSPPAGARWVDIGCGTGALASAIKDLAAPESMLACDLSASFVAYARAKHPDRRVSFVVGTAESLVTSTGAVDYVASGLVLNFLPDPAHSISAMRRLVRSGGTVAAYVWDYAGGVEFLHSLWDEAVEIDPSAVTQDERARFPICNPSGLMALFVDNGLVDVAGSSLEVPTDFRDFDDFWMPLTRGTGPAPSYVASLSVDLREALRRRLVRRLKAEPDGTIRRRARAWAIKGTVPE